MLIWWFQKGFLPGDLSTIHADAHFWSYFDQRFDTAVICGY